MKKRLALLLTLSIIISLFPNNIRVMAKSIASSLLYKSTTIMNLDPTGKELQNDKNKLKNILEDSIIKIDSSQYDFPTITLNGEVEYKNTGKTVPFNLVGNFKNTGDYQKVCLYHIHQFPLQQH